MFLEILPASQKQIAELEVNMKEQADQIAKLPDIDYKKDCAINIMQ